MTRVSSREVEEEDGTCEKVQNVSSVPATAAAAAAAGGGTTSSSMSVDVEEEQRNDMSQFEDASEDLFDVFPSSSSSAKTSREASKSGISNNMHVGNGVTSNTASTGDDDHDDDDDDDNEFNGQFMDKDDDEDGDDLFFPYMMTNDNDDEFN